MLDAKAVVQRERRLTEQLLKETERMLKENEAFRQSLAAEIYEHFSQQLVGALLHFQGFEHLEQENPVEAQEAFRTAMKLLGDALAEARRIANESKSSVLDGSSDGLGSRQKIPSFFRS